MRYQVKKTSGYLTRMFSIEDFESNKNQSCSNQYQRCRNLSGINKVPKFRHIYFDLLSNRKANNVNTIPSTNDFVNLKGSEIEPNAIPNHAAAKLPQIPARTLSQEDLSALLNDSLINKYANIQHIFFQ